MRFTSSVPSAAASRMRMMLPPKTGLLIIDVQKAIDHPSWGRRNNPDAEKNIARLLFAWRESDRPLIHVRHVSREPHSTYRPGQDGVEFKDEVKPHDGEVVVTKHTNSAFIATELEDVLRREEILALVICGVITNNSVEATARMAGSLGYETYVVSDATATFDKVDFAGVFGRPMRFTPCRLRISMVSTPRCSPRPRF